jgi:hypothetical protein
MLRRPDGATIVEIVEATGWQPHTVRGALAGALKKRLGLVVTSEKCTEARSGLSHRLSHLFSEAAAIAVLPGCGHTLSRSCGS